MYSSIEKKDRVTVVNKCYWPLIELSKKGYHIGIEAPAITLEIISDVDPLWIDALKEQIRQNHIEFIGSGYSQIIGPLVPAKVNDWNQKIGLQVYQSLLEMKPRIALVNEMAYSSGVVEHYLNYGYSGIIMEWNNPIKYHPEWKNEWRYFTQYAISADGRNMPLFWADSIAFQKFQRYTHGEIELDAYYEYLQRYDSDSVRYFPLYANDVEIFNYRPGRYQTEAGLISSIDEWERIYLLYDSLSQCEFVEFLFPSQILKGLNEKNGGNSLHLESSEQPIPVKKQEKYNINRWALTGRDDLGINTKCHRIYQSLIENKDDESDHWKELCYLWSSDFRTHITDFRWKEYLDRLNGYSYVKSDYRNSRVINDLISVSLPFQQNNISITEERNYINYENDKIFLSFDKNKGFTISECIFKNISDKPLFGMIKHGYYDDISYGADFYTGHCVIEPPGKHKITDLSNVQLRIYNGDTISFLSTTENSDIRFESEITISDCEINISKKITLPSRSLQTVHPFHITFNPHAWDYKTLYFKTHNGGKCLEKYYLTDNVNHSDILSSLISAKHGLGATEGILIIGDKNKALKIQHEPSVSAMIPSVIFSKLSDKNYFLRLQYSAQEIDETLKILRIKGNYYHIDVNLFIQVGSC